MSRAPSVRSAAARPPMSLRRVATLAALVVACAWWLTPGTARAAGAEVVAQVSLLIGQARVVRADGKSESLSRGAQILVGDRIETGANGHVHLRFVDNGAASVRPDSTLEVQAYHYDAQNPRNNEVRLRVEHGVARSISGAATEADKNRFRLNTPIAAIGVRGTDFLVKADESGVRATVADGAIVVGALGAGCLASGLGPCTGGDARVLSADMGRLMAEVRPGERIARVVPAGAGVADLAAHGAEERATAQFAAESAARLAGLQAAETKGFAQMRDSDIAAASVLSIVTPETKNLNTPPDLSAQLVWGRWGPFRDVNDNVTLPYAIAGVGRETTSATFTQEDVGLLRAKDPTGRNELVNTTDARVDFRLSRAQASYSIDNRIEAASVDGGVLSLDFGQRTFATALALSSPTAGRTELRMGGDVASDGTFAVKDATQKVSGAVSFDSKEVGYLFERAFGGGLFRGRTLWGR